MVIFFFAAMIASTAGRSSSGRGRPQGRGRQQGRASSARRTSQHQRQGNSGRGRDGPQLPQEQPQQAEEIVNDTTHVSEEEMMSFGLALAGFPGRRQNVRHELNLSRFRSFYGVSPKAIAKMFNSLVSADAIKSTKSMTTIDALIAINWLRLYDTEHVLAGRWNMDEDTLRPLVKRVTKAIQGLKVEKVMEKMGASNHLRSCLFLLVCTCHQCRLRLMDSAITLSDRVGKL